MTAPEMKSGRAVGNIDHDGTFYAHDSEVSLPAEVFDRLLAVGAVTTEARAVPVEAEVDLPALIRAAIQGLPPEGFGADKAPLLAAVKAALPEGAKVTKAALAAVWEEISKGA